MISTWNFSCLSSVTISSRSEYWQLRCVQELEDKQCLCCWGRFIYTRHFVEAAVCLYAFWCRLRRSTLILKCQRYSQHFDFFLEGHTEKKLPPLIFSSLIPSPNILPLKILSTDVRKIHFHRVFRGIKCFKSQVMNDVWHKTFGIERNNAAEVEIFSVSGWEHSLYFEDVCWKIRQIRKTSRKTWP